MAPRPARLASLVADARSIFAAGVEEASAPAMLASHRGLVAEALADRAAAHVLGVGKAAMAMAGALEAACSDVAFTGEATVPHGYPATYPKTLPRPRRLRVRTAGHPLPDAHSEAAGRAALSLARSLGPDDLLLVLLSGGGSALWTTPRPGLSLGDLTETTERLLASGLPIQTVNAVRKRLAALSGGRLAAAAHPARVLALAVSDVVGDDLAAIASGPTVGDGASLALPTDVRRPLPEAVRHALEAPDAAPRAPDDPRLGTTETHLIGSNRIALEAAARHARSLGYAAEIVTDAMTGEARDVGAAHARALLDADEAPRALLWGGEPTVTVTGDGRGGRNQEAALGAALALDGAAHPAVLLCGGTDGIDGPTEAAGGWATPDTVQTGQSRGLDAVPHLHRNDAHAYLGGVGGLLITGPTHTNVMDLHVGLVGRP